MNAKFNAHANSLRRRPHTLLSQMMRFRFCLCLMCFIGCNLIYYLIYRWSFEHRDRTMRIAAIGVKQHNRKKAAVSTPEKIIENKRLFADSNIEYESEWISLIGYISYCDVHEDIEYSGIFDEGSWLIQDRRSFANIKHGDLVCMTGDQLVKDFVPNLLPLYDESDIEFTIFTWIRPRSFPSELDGIDMHEFERKILANRHITHIYCVDYDGTQFTPPLNEKLSGVPLGIDYHNKLYKGTPLHPAEQERIVNGYISRSLSLSQYTQRELRIFRDDMNNYRVRRWPKSRRTINKYFRFIKKTNRSFVSLWLETNLWQRIDHNFAAQCDSNDSWTVSQVFRRNVARWDAYHRIDDNLVCNEMERMTDREIFDQRSKYVFILSPWGGGLDCYRTWESLMFGHIVITLTSPLDTLYQGLPVVTVKHWNEITAENLQLWYRRYFFNQTAQNNHAVKQRLTTKYWVDRMKRHKH